MKRWIIRSFFIALLLLSLSTWRWTASHTAELACMQADLWSLQVGGGQVGLEYWPDYREKYGWRAGEPTWRWWVSTPSSYVFDDSDYTAGGDFVGFFLAWNDPYQHGQCAAGIPCWFLSILSAALLWLVWRKTRPQGKGRAFPVEVPAIPANLK